MALKRALRAEERVRRERGDDLGEHPRAHHEGGDDGADHTAAVPHQQGEHHAHHVLADHGGADHEHQGEHDRHREVGAVEQVDVVLEADPLRVRRGGAGQRRVGERAVERREDGTDQEDDQQADGRDERDGPGDGPAAFCANVPCAPGAAAGEILPGRARRSRRRRVSTSLELLRLRLVFPDDADDRVVVRLRRLGR